MLSARKSLTFVLVCSIGFGVPSRVHAESQNIITPLALLATAGVLGHATKKAIQRLQKAETAEEKKYAKRWAAISLLGATTAGMGAIYAGKKYLNAPQHERRDTQHSSTTAVSRTLQPPPPPSPSLSERAGSNWRSLLQKISIDEDASDRESTKPYAGAPISLRLLRTTEDRPHYHEGVLPFIIDPAAENQISPYSGEPIPASLLNAAISIQKAIPHGLNEEDNNLEWEKYLGRNFREQCAQRGSAEVYIGHGVVIKPGNIASVFRAYKVAKYGKSVLKALQRKKKRGSPTAEGSFAVTPLYLVRKRDSAEDISDATQYFVLSEKININKMPREQKEAMLPAFADHLRAAAASGDVGDLHASNINLEPDIKHIDLFDFDRPGGYPMGARGTMHYFLETKDYPPVFSQLITHMNALLTQIVLRRDSPAKCKKEIGIFLQKAHRIFSDKYLPEVQKLEAATHEILRKA